MAVDKISMAINYRKNKSTRLSSGGKYYAEVDRQKTLSTRGLAQHLKDHNCMVGRDAIMAVLIKLSECLPELVAQGVGVKLDGLGIFDPSVLNEKGGATEAQMLDKTFNDTIKEFPTTFKDWKKSDLNDYTKATQMAKARLNSDLMRLQKEEERAATDADAYAIWHGGYGGRTSQGALDYAAAAGDPKLKEKRGFK